MTWLVIFTGIKFPTADTAGFRFVLLLLSKCSEFIVAFKISFSKFKANVKFDPAKCSVLLSFSTYNCNKWRRNDCGHEYDGISMKNKNKKNMLERCTDWRLAQHYEFRWGVFHFQLPKQDLGPVSTKAFFTWLAYFSNVFNGSAINLPKKGYEQMKVLNTFALLHEGTSKASTWSINLFDLHSSSSLVFFLKIAVNMKTYIFKNIYTEQCAYFELDIPTLWATYFIKY